MAGSHEDITDRKAAEEELARERHLLHTLLDNLPDAIFFCDTANRVIRINKALADLFGLEGPAKAVGKTHFDFLSAEVARQLTEENQEIIRTGHPILAKEDKVLVPGGRRLWLSRTKMPFRDRDGNIIGTFGVIRDITERRKANDTLRQSEERYRSVVAAMQHGILLLDADGGIRECNAAAERILGLSAEQLTGRMPLDPRWRAVHADGSPFPGEEHPPMVTLRTGRPCAGVVLGVYKPDGTLTWVTVNAQPLFQADGRTPAGVVASFEDVTDRKRTEERLRQTAERLACCEQQLRRLTGPEGGPVLGPDSARD
jgi:PAS domain S-box-containing protein